MAAVMKRLVNQWSTARVWSTMKMEIFAKFSIFSLRLWELDIIFRTCRKMGNYRAI